MTHGTTRSRGRQRVSAVEPRLGLSRALAAGVAAAIALGVALSMPLSAAADSGRGDGHDKRKKAWVAPTLSTAAPSDTFRVIVQGRAAGTAVDAAVQKHPGKAKGAKKHFSSISAVSAELTGEQIAELAQAEGIDAITVDVPVAVAGGPKGSRTDLIWNAQKWPFISDAATQPASRTPATAGAAAAVAAAKASVRRKRG